MGSNWAQEFREKVEASEGKYGATENFDDVDEEEEEVELEEEAEEVEQEPEEAEVEKPTPRPVLDVGERAADMMAAMTGEKEPAKRSNPEGAMMAAMMGLLILQSLPTIFNTVSSAFQPLVPSGGRSPQNYPVQCQYCGYQCLGYNGMPCPRCGRS